MSSGEEADYSRPGGATSSATPRANTFDYFIHKDLGDVSSPGAGLLHQERSHAPRRCGETSPRRASSSTYPRSRLSANISGKIIDFLAQIEDFQKKLWLKKKFVVETQYCIAVGSIPEEFYTEIAVNEAQREEWVRLFAIDEIKGDLSKPGYSAKIKPEISESASGAAGGYTALR